MVLLNEYAISKISEDSYNENDVICTYAGNRFVWFGTEARGIYQYDKILNKWNHFTAKNGLYDHNVFDIVEDNNLLWVRMACSLQKYDIKHNQWGKRIYISSLPADLSESDIQIFENFIWCTNRNDLYMIDKNTEIEKKVLSLSDFMINNMQIDKDLIWFTGLCGSTGFCGNKDKDNVMTFNKITKKTEEILSLPKDETVYSNGLNVDEKNVWLITNKGIYKINKENKTMKKVLYHGLSKGLRIKHDKRYIWFSGSEGIYRFDKKHEVMKETHTYSNQLIQKEPITFFRRRCLLFEDRTLYADKVKVMVPDSVWDNIFDYDIDNIASEDYESVWIGGKNRKIFQYHRDENKWINHTVDLIPESSERKAVRPGWKIYIENKYAMWNICFPAGYKNHSEVNETDENEVILIHSNLAIYSEDYSPTSRNSATLFFSIDSQDKPSEESMYQYITSRFNNNQNTIQYIKLLKIYKEITINGYAMIKVDTQEKKHNVDLYFIERDPTTYIRIAVKKIKPQKAKKKASEIRSIINSFEFFK